MQNALKISEAANIAVHSLAYMANHMTDVPVSACLLARELKVSESHLSKVLQKLVKMKLLKSTRGARGGFILTQKVLESITLLQVIEAVDGKLSSQGCLFPKPICKAESCRLSELNQKIYRTIYHHLRELSLKDFKMEISHAFEEST